MMTIDCYDATETMTKEQLALVQQILSFAAKEEKLDGTYEISITFVDDKEIQQINATYRDKNAPTDVISFALEEEGEGEIAFERPEGMPVTLGDIIVSVDTLHRQAKEYNHSLERELGFLVVHGFLHLLGYDHMNKEDEIKMFGRQHAILEAYGLSRE